MSQNDPANNQNLLNNIDEHYKIRANSFLSNIINMEIDPMYFREIDCKTPFNGSHFYKIRVEHDELNQEHPFQLKICSTPQSNQEFSIIMRKGLLLSSEERTTNYLTREIQAYQRMNRQNEIFIPLGFSINANEYKILFQTKLIQITSVFPSFNRISLEQRFLIIKQIESILQDAHQNNIIGFCLNTFNLFYDRYSRRISILGYIGNDSIFNINDFQNIQWNTLLAPELISGGNYPTIKSDIYQFGALIGIILDQEMERWSNGVFDQSFRRIEEQLYNELRSSMSESPEERRSLDDLSQVIQNCCETTIRDPNMQVLRLIKNQLPFLHLDQLQGMDLVVFLGNTQVGKSSTINALRGCRYTQEKGRLRKVQGVENEAEIGDRTGLSCTLLPSVYIDEINNIAYLDTRGFNDIREQSASFEIASSFLIEIAIRTARNIKLVVLETFSKLRAGLADFNQIGQAVQKIIKNQRSYVFCFFLFNRYLPLSEKAQEFYSSDEQQKTRMIFEEIVENSRNMFSSQIDHERFQFLTLLYENMQVGHFGYIDPCDQNSINRLIETLKDDSLNCNKNDLKFTGFNIERIRFNDILIPRLSLLSYLIRSLFTLPDEQSLDQLTTTLNQEIETHDRNIAMIHNLDDERIHDQIQPLIELYQHSSQEEIEALLDLKGRAQHELVEAISSIEEFMVSKEDVLVDEWECWGTDYIHTTEYTGSVPWEEEQVTLDNPEFTTIKSKTGSPQTTEYKIEFENNSPPTRDSQIAETIGEATMDGLNAGGTVMVAGFCAASLMFLCAPLAITAGVFVSPFAIAGAAVTAGEAIMIGTPILGAISGIYDAKHLPRERIAGKVVLKALKRNIPSKQIELVELNGRADNIRNRISQINRDIIALDRRRASEIAVQIANKKEKSIVTLEKITLIKNTIRCIFNFLTRNINDISLYIELSTRLSGQDDGGDQEIFSSIARFGGILMQWIQNGARNVPAFHWEQNMIDIQISQLIGDIEQLKRDLATQELYGIFDLNPFN